MEFLLALVGDHLGTIIGGVVAFLGVVFAFFKVKDMGRQEEKHRQTEEALKDERARNDLEQELRNTPPAELEQLQKPWFRPRR